MLTFLGFYDRYFQGLKPILRKFYCYLYLLAYFGNVNVRREYSIYFSSFSALNNLRISSMSGRALRSSSLMSSAVL